MSIVNRINEFYQVKTGLEYDRCFPYLVRISVFRAEWRVVVGSSPSSDEMSVYKSICSSGCNCLGFSGTDSSIASISRCHEGHTYSRNMKVMLKVSTHGGL